MLKGNYSDDDPVLFSSFNAGYEDDSGIDTRPRRYYIIVKMRKGETLEVVSIRTVPYQTVCQLFTGLVASSDEPDLRFLRIVQISIRECV